MQSFSPLHKLHGVVVRDTGPGSATLRRLDLSEPRFASPDNGAVIVEQCVSGASRWC